MPFALSPSRHWQALLAVVLVHVLLLASLAQMPAPGGGQGPVLAVEVLVAPAGNSAPGATVASPVPVPVPAATAPSLAPVAPPKRASPVVNVTPRAAVPAADESAASADPGVATAATEAAAGGASAATTGPSGDIAMMSAAASGAATEGVTQPPRLGPGARKPVYPEGSRWAREAGRVTLRLRVRADGTVAESAVLHTSGFPRLDRAARDAALRWRLEPARRDGEAVDAALDTTLEFRLED